MRGIEGNHCGDSGSSSRKGVKVQVLSSAPNTQLYPSSSSTSIPTRYPRTFPPRVLVGICRGAARLDRGSFHRDSPIAGTHQDALGIVKLDLIVSYLRRQYGQRDGAGFRARHPRIVFRLCVVKRSGIGDRGGDGYVALPPRRAIVPIRLALFRVAELDRRGSDPLTLRRGNGDGRTDEGGTDHRVLPGERGKLGH